MTDIISAVSIEASDTMAKRISASGIYRLALYNRYLSNLDEDGRGYVASQQLAEVTGHTAAQVRKDLTFYGSLGEPGKGYEIAKLRKMLTGVFEKENPRNVILVGVGNLGRALIAYRGFQLQQFNIVAAFDSDEGKTGGTIEGVPIHDIKDMEFAIADKDVQIAIVAVPASAAQKVVDRLVSSGIKGILNFAPTIINVPEDIKLQNVDMSVELDVLYHSLRNLS